MTNDIIATGRVLVRITTSNGWPVSKGFIDGRRR